MSALVVTAPWQSSEIPRLSQIENLRVIRVNTYWEAREVLGVEPGLQVVVTDQRLPDGNWYSLLADMTRRGCEADLVVLDRCGNPRLRDQVLSHGARYAGPGTPGLAAGRSRPAMERLRHRYVHGASVGAA